MAQRARRNHVRCVTSRERACGGAFACAHTRTLAACRRPRLLRQSTAADRGRGPSRWRSGVSLDVNRLQPARRSAHATQACVLRHLSLENLRWRVRVCTHANAGCCRRPRLARRSTAGTEGEGRLAGAVGLSKAWTDFNQRGAARTHRMRACCVTSRERAGGGAFACAHTRTPAARWRALLARQSTAVDRVREPSRWRSELA